MATKEQKLEEQLRAIKVEKRKKAEASFDKWQTDIKKERLIELTGGVYRLAFGPDYGQDQISPEKVVHALKERAIFVRHEWSGEVRDVFQGRVVTTKQPEVVFEPIDKGRPSTVLCNLEGKPLFSLSVYKDGLKGQELVVYPVNEIHAW
jgi:hypothetical protein